MPARMVLTTRTLAERLATAPVAPCCVDAPQVIAALAGRAIAPTDADRVPLRFGLLILRTIYTSGSTGAPGRRRQPQSLAHYLDAVALVLGDEPQSMPLLLRRPST